MHLNYKKYIGYITAGLFGVLLVVGLRGASAANQTDLPSSNVIPNVSGLNVQGGAKIQEMLEVAGVTVSGNIDLSGDLQASKTIQADGELRAKGGIVNPTETKYGSVTVGSPVEITDPQGLNIKNGTLDVNQAETDASGNILDALNVDGFVSINKGGLLTTRCNSDSDAEPYYCMTIGYTGDDVHTASILVKGPLKIAGAVKGPSADPLTIDDDLDVMGNINGTSVQISGKASFLGDTEIKNAYITGSLQNSAADGFVKIDDELDVRKGIFNNDGTKLIKFGSGSSPMDLSVTGKSTLSGNVDIKGEISNSTPKSGTVSGLTQPVNIKDDLKVTGNITATGKIGKYTIRNSGPHSVSGGGSLTKEKACNSGETVISCGYKGDSVSSGDYDFGLELNNLLLGTSSCKVSVKNTIANKLDLYVYTMCFDPTTN